MPTSDTLQLYILFKIDIEIITLKLFSTLSDVWYWKEGVIINSKWFSVFSYQNTRAQKKSNQHWVPNLLALLYEILHPSSTMLRSFIN